MAPFDPWSALAGGGMIGLAAALLMLVTGRIAGVSGIASRLFSAGADDRNWRLSFIAGLIAAPLVSGLAGYPLQVPWMPASWPPVIIAGLLVGFGSRLGSGCTSGHGVCGVARLSPRSLVATAIFVLTAIVTTTIMRHVIGA